MHILTWLIALPFIISLVALIFPPVNPRTLKKLVLIGSLLPLILLLLAHGKWIGTGINYPWMPALKINFHLSVDALSLVFLYLTALIVPLSITAMNSLTLSYANVFYGLVFLLEGLLFCFFTAQDLAIFTFFWEAMLIPLYFLINLWGKEYRQAAALKFLIYMIAGSCLMVAAVLVLFFTTGANTFDIAALARTAVNAPYTGYACAIFLLAFAVKTPLFPFHAWLPDTYYQASTPSTILLAGILSKAGVYGILRVGLEIFPNYIVSWSPLLLGLAITGVLYGGLAAWRQNDYKRLIAYSSLSHINFVLAGLFVWSEVAHEGAILQAVNHGITIAALFLAAGWLEDRIGTTALGTVSGLSKYFPMLCWVTLLFVLSSVALPGTNNFVGELLILFGVFGYNPYVAATLGLTVILSVIYMLRFMQKVYFETPSEREPQWVDMRWREWLVAAPLIILILGIGIYPAPILKHIQPAAEKVSVIAQTKDLT